MDGIKSLSPGGYQPGLGSSTVDQVLKYTKYPKYIPSTSTGQVKGLFQKSCFCSKVKMAIFYAE